MDADKGEVVDLSDLLPQDTAELHMLIPGTNKRLGWVLTMAGPGHPKTVAASNENRRKDLQRSARIEQAQVNGRKYKADDVQPDESRRDFVAGLVARIVDWTPVRFSKDSPPITFNDAAAVDLLLQPRMAPYVAQITDFVLDEKSFMTASAIS